MRMCNIIYFDVPEAAVFPLFAERLQTSKVKEGEPVPFHACVRQTAARRHLVQRRRANRQLARLQHHSGALSLLYSQCVL